MFSAQAHVHRVECQVAPRNVDKQFVHTLVLDNQTLSKPHMYYYHYLSIGWLDIITSTADNYYVQQRLIVDKL